MKHTRIVTVSLIAVPVIAGVAAYLVRQNHPSSASQTPTSTTISTAPAAPQPANGDASRIHLRSPHTREAAPTDRRPSQTGEEKSEDGPAFVKDIDSASFPRTEHQLLANDAEALPDDGSADFSPNAHFSGPLTFVYRGGLGGSGGHRPSPHQGSSVSELGSSNNIPSNNGTTDSKNAPSQSNPSPSSSHNGDSSPSHDDANHDASLADNSSHDSHHDESTPHDTSEPTRQDDSKNGASDDQLVAPIAFNEPKNERPVQVPEPGTLGLLGLGLLGLARRRKVQQ